MELRFDIEEPLVKKPKQTFLSRCNTKWSSVSWLGLVTYISIACLNYVIGYFAIYRQFGWTTQTHSHVRIFGDIVTVGWFALGFVSLPWHDWERYTCIKTGDVPGLMRFLLWWWGTIITFYVYGQMGQDPLFQTSLASNLTTGQRNVYVVVFSIIGLIVMYWLAKLCTCQKKLCNPTTGRKIIFLRVLALVAFLFLISYIVCSEEDSCVYHPHHWWFGFTLVLISTTTLDNSFDYFLQGVFWTFLIEAIFNYGLTFNKFFT